MFLQTLVTNSQITWCQTQKTTVRIFNKNQKSPISCLCVVLTSPASLVPSTGALRMFQHAAILKDHALLPSPCHSQNFRPLTFISMLQYPARSSKWSLFPTGFYHQNYVSFLVSSSELGFQLIVASFLIGCDRKNSNSKT
jgi:hypothetical protein